MLVLYPELEQKNLIDQNNETLLPVIRKIRQVFEDHFDRTWFSIIIDGLPFDFRTIRIIRELATLQSIHVGDESKRNVSRYRPTWRPGHRQTASRKQSLFPCSVT